MCFLFHCSEPFHSHRWCTAQYLHKSTVRCKRCSLSLVSCKMEVSPSSNNLSSDKMKSFQQCGIIPSSPLALVYILLILLFQHRKCFSVSGRNTLLRRCNPSPVLPFVPWCFVEYEPGPTRHTSTLTQRHTEKKKNPIPPRLYPYHQLWPLTSAPKWDSLLVCHIQ